MRGSKFLLVSAAVLIASGGAAQERGQVAPFREYGEPSRNTEDVERFVHRFREAWGSQDVDLLRALHADDVEWINAYGRMFRGA